MDILVVLVWSGAQILSHKEFTQTKKSLSHVFTKEK
jgi:hypothetical protein